MRSVLRHYGLNLLIVFSALFIQGCGGGSGGGGRGASAAPPIREPQVVVQVIEPNGAQGAVDTLYLAESGTQVLRKIANLGEHFSERHFSVSPGGKSLAYWSLDGANAPNIYSFWISNVDGSDKRLIHLSAFEPEFYWAPDGQSILYLADEGVDQVTRLIKVADGQQVVLTAPGQRIEGFSWSDDSTHFAYGVHTLGSDHSVSTLDLTTDVTNHLLATSDWIYLVSISQNGQYVAINTTGSVGRLYIVDTGQGQTTLFDNVFLYDFDWVPDRNIAYYVNGFSGILNLLDLRTLQSTPIKYGNGDDVLADEVFPSPDATQLFYNTYGLTNDVVGLVRVSDNYVQYSRQLTALDHPWGVVSWSPSSTKAAVGYTEFVSIVDALALSEAEITRADSTSLGSVSKIEWLSEKRIALQINDDIYVGERSKNNFQKAGEVNHSVDATFDLLPEGGALFYLSGAAVNGVAPPAFSYYGLPVFYDVKAGRYDVLRLPNGDVPSASHFQVVK